MRILKNKVAKALERSKKNQKPTDLEQDKNSKETKAQMQVCIKTKGQSCLSLPVDSCKEKPVNLSLRPKGSTSCKNIMKNYSRALTSFAISSTAESYLKKILQDHQTELAKFQEFIQQRKPKVNCIKSLREILLVNENDSTEVKVYKNVFQKISIIFMKYFSVNWIYHGKVVDRIAHLKYRFKILRRIKNPIHFTYLEEFSK